MEKKACINIQNEKGHIKNFKETASKNIQAASQREGKMLQQPISFQNIIWQDTTHFTGYDNS